MYSEIRGWPRKKDCQALVQVHVFPEHVSEHEFFSPTLSHSASFNANPLARVCPFLAWKFRSAMSLSIISYREYTRAHVNISELWPQIHRVTWLDFFFTFFRIILYQKFILIFFRRWNCIFMFESTRRILPYLTFIYHNIWKKLIFENARSETRK